MIMADEKKIEDNGNEAMVETAPQEESEDMKEKFLRLAAEFDNYKKRTRKDIDDAGMLGKATLMKEILPVVDEFQLAMAAMDKAGDKDMLKGIAMLYSNFMDTLNGTPLGDIL